MTARPSTSITAEPSATRLPGLDLIRAAAILLVIIHHLRWLPGAPVALKWFGLRAYIGVDLFFVLSGWLIGGQLFRELARTGEVDLRRFWAKRWLRTLPAYYAVLLVLVMLGRLTPGDVPGMAVFLQNYVDPMRWLVTWSLCIEEHFYLVLPVLVVALTRLPRWTVPWFAAASVGVSVVARGAAFPAMSAGTYGDFLGDFYSPTHLRLDGLVIGVLLAAVRVFVPSAWAMMLRHRGVLAAGGLAVILLATWSPWATGTGIEGVDRMRFFAAVPGFLIVSLGTGALVPWAATVRFASAWALAPIRWVAEHAYALYLTHELAIEAGRRLSPDSFSRAVPIVLLLAGLFAVLLRSGVEQPVLKWRDRWLRSRVAEREPAGVTSAAPSA